MTFRSLRKITVALSLFGAAALVVSVSGCSSLAPAAIVVPTSAASTQTGLEKAFAAINNKFGGDAILTELDINDDKTVTVDAIDPKKPTDLNEWTYTTTGLKQTATVDYGGDTEALKSNEWKLSTLSPSVVAKAIEQAPNDAKTKGLPFSSLSVQYTNVREDLYISVIVKDDRNHGSADFGLDGALLASS